MSEPFSPASSRSTSTPSLTMAPNDALGRLGLVAEEFGGADPLAQAVPDRLGRGFARPGPGAAGLGALARHRGVEAVDVDRQAARAQRVLGEVEREAVGVVELEGGLAGKHAALRQRPRLVLEDCEPARERGAKARLLELERLGDQRLGAEELRIGLAHLARQRRHEAPHQRIARSENLGVAHGAAHDPAQHVAAALVRRQHAVGDQKGGGAQMVGDDAVRGALRPVRIDASEVGDGADQRAKEVDVVVVVHALQDGGDPLEPHAGVDRGARQVDALAARQRLVLHEHQVPDLDEPVAVGVGRAGRTAKNVVAMIEEDFGARTAGAGVAHRPEIVAGRDADDALVGQAGDRLPQIEGLIIVVIDRDGEPLLGNAEIAGQQPPGEFDRVVLEVVAEGEVAQHLEEGVVAGGVADVVEVVVLAAGAHALLGGRCADVGPLLDAGEDVLELNHAGVGEHQRRIVARDERARGRDLMALPREELQKARSDLVDAAHVRFAFGAIFQRAF